MLNIFRKKSHLFLTSFGALFGVSIFILAKSTNQSNHILIVASLPFLLAMLFYIVGKQYTKIQNFNHQLNERIKEKTDELKKFHKETEQILGALPDLLFKLNKEGLITYYFSSNHQLFFVQSESIIGKMMQDFLPKEVVPHFQKSHEAAFRTNEIQVLNYDISTLKEFKTLEARIIPSDEELIVVIRDITELKRAQDALIEKNSLTQRHQGMIDLIVTYNHEINNPLTIAFMLLKKNKSFISENDYNDFYNSLERIKEIIVSIKEIKSKSPEEIETSLYLDKLNFVKIKKGN